jgi:hypothetical protein
MRMTVLLCVMLASLITGAVAAQDRPNFSGQWILVNPQDSASNTPQEITIKQEAPLLSVERRFEGLVRSETYRIGIEGGVVGGVGRNDHTSRTRFSVTWDGDRLVIETGSYSGPTLDSGPYTEHEEMWSLQAQDRLFMTVTERSSGVEPTTTKLIYSRR